MKNMKSFPCVILAASFSFSASIGAQPNAQGDTQRDIYQQERIEQGLRSGELNTKEAARLEHDQQRIDQMESHDLKDGKIGPKEQKKLNRAQAKANQDIYRKEHNRHLGNPDSATSERMQSNVQRNINQQQRIEHGFRSGNLTTREAARLEHGQARVSHGEARSGSDGFVGRREERHIQGADNRQGQHIYAHKHDHDDDQDHHGQ